MNKLLSAVSLLLSLDTAPRTCLVCDLETRAPLRDVKVTVDSIPLGKTNYSGQIILPDSFKTAVFSKTGYHKETLLAEETRQDTVFLLPNSHRIDEITIWGKKRINMDEIRRNHPPADILRKERQSLSSFDFFSFFDFKGKKDKKQARKLREIFKRIDEEEDPMEKAYKQSIAEKQKKETILPDGQH